MRTLTWFIIMLSFITLPVLKFYIDWRRYVIKEQFVKDFTRQGIQFSANVYGDDTLLQLNEDFWRHNRVVYVPFIYKNKRVTTERFTVKNKYTLSSNVVRDFYYHGNIYFKLS